MSPSCGAAPSTGAHRRQCDALVPTHASRACVIPFRPLPTCRWSTYEFSDKTQQVQAAERVARARAEPAPRVRGRDGELTALGEHLDRLLSGAGTVVLIEGAAGMGKSRLLAEVAAMAGRLSMTIGLG